MITQKQSYDLGAGVFRIENSTLCGAHCIMCPRSEVNYPFEQMPWNLFKKTVDEAVALGTKNIAIGGFGDPLMDTKIEERLSYIKSNYSDIVVSMFNTGHLLDSAKADICCKYLDVIKFSHYGFSKECYEAVHRGHLKYEEIKRNIDEFLARSDKPYTIMSYLIFPENEHDMDKWREYYEPKCDRIDIWKPHNWGGTTSMMDAPILFPCKRATILSDVQVCTNGEVVVCCFDYDRTLVLGNLNVQTLEEILESDFAREIAAVHLEKRVMESNYRCKNCDQIRGREDALIYCNNKNFQMQDSSVRM